MTEVTRQILKDQARWLESQLATAREQLAQFEQHVERQRALVDRLERETRDISTDLANAVEVAL